MAAPTTSRPTTPDSNPPRTYFSVWQRLFRGYGPLAVFAILLVVMALLVPSKVPSSTGNLGQSSGLAAGTSAGTGGAGTGGGTGSSSGGNTALGGNGTPGNGASAAGTASSGGSTGSAGANGATGGTSGGTSSQPAVPAGTAPAAVAAGVGHCSGQQVSGDPYGPPCMTFSGSNGGATSKGVTATQINVAYRVTSDKGFQQTLAQLAGANLQDTQADIERTITALAQYFNTHYQFYGRKLNIEFYNGQGALTNELLGNGQAQAEADAVTVGQQMKAWGDMSAESEPYADALARQGVMGFGDPYMSQAWHQQHSPYIWSIAADGTKVATFAAEYAAQKLCPAPDLATYAGGALKNKPRKFATLAPDNSWYQESVQVSRSYAQQHGCNPGENVEYQLDLGTMSNQAANIIAKLQSDGVTTILCGCDPIIPVFLSSQAARQNYFPEFIITGTALTDQDIVGQLWNQQFATHAFGISPNEIAVPSTQTLGYAAYKSVRNDEPAFGVDLIYDQMAMMAIGIQMAGPHLTPQNFQLGMQAYPGHVGPAGYWDFPSGNFTIGEDVHEICWNPTATSTYNGKQGAFVETSNQRWQFGQIPAGKPGCPIPSS